MKRVIAFGIAFMLLIPVTAKNESESQRCFVNNEDGKILYVGGNGPNNYSKIQDAINDAENGDTIFVYHDSSPYYESIVINKSISLIGEYRWGTIIMANEKDAVNITAYNVNITGLTILTLSDEWPCAGIKLFKTRNVSILDCDIYFSPIGIYGYVSDRNKIENCDIGKNSCGVMLNLSEENSFLNCDIHHNLEEGFLLLGSHNNLITNCSIYDNDEGIMIFGNKNTICESSVIENHNGISVTGVLNRIQKCNIYKNSFYGVLLIAAFKNMVFNNNIYKNGLNAFFANAALNLWLHNYWGLSLPLPKPIFGFLVWAFREIAIPWFNFDLMPRMKAYGE